MKDVSRGINLDDARVSGRGTGGRSREAYEGMVSEIKNKYLNDLLVYSELPLGMCEEQQVKTQQIRRDHYLEKILPGSESVDRRGEMKATELAVRRASVTHLMTANQGRGGRRSSNILSTRGVAIRLIIYACVIHRVNAKILINAP